MSAVRVVDPPLTLQYFPHIRNGWTGSWSQPPQLGVKDKSEHFCASHSDGHSTASSVPTSALTLRHGVMDQWM